MYVILYKVTISSRVVRCYEYLEEKDRAEEIAIRFRKTNHLVWVRYIEDPRQ